MDEYLEDMDDQDQAIDQYDQESLHDTTGDESQVHDPIDLRSSKGKERITSYSPRGPASTLAAGSGSAVS